MYLGSSLRALYLSPFHTFPGPPELKKERSPVFGVLFLVISTTIETEFTREGVRDGISRQKRGKWTVFISAEALCIKLLVPHLMYT